MAGRRGRGRGGGPDDPVRGTYGEAAEGEALALASSDGRVEIAVRNGSAAQALGVGAGAAVVLRPVGTG
jgi:hypothetical protein